MTPIAGALGPQLELQDSGVVKAPDLKTLLNNPIFLGAIVGVLVILLGWGLYQASRRIEGMPPEDGA